MPNQHPSTLQIQTELNRDLGLPSALAIGIGTMIAAGIFTLSGLAIRNVGSAAVVAFLLAALVALFTALVYCEFVSIYPESGEGYLYARMTFAPPLAYFAGWALVLGYTSSCAFYIASLSSYFEEFIFAGPVRGLSGIVALVALTLLNIRGTKESGLFQIVITLAKVALLVWFVVGGLTHVNTAEIIDRFSTDIVQIGSTAGMVFITFFGFSAIAASAGEVRDPVRTIPRAIFISMGTVTVLYALVVLVVLSAGLTEYTEASMGVAARAFLGPIGGTVIVAGALFSMISASNASIMAGSRVVLAMSRLGHFPREFGAVNPTTRTPIVALMLVGGTILAFSLTLGLEDLAHFADTVLLLALILVNAALIHHRRKFPNIERPFRIPLVPLLPAVGIGANLYLLTQILHHPLPVGMAIGCLALGVVAFLTWKGAQPQEDALPGKPSRVALGRFATSEGTFRVLVPLAHPAHVNQLIDLASSIAHERKGNVVALRVVTVPDQVPPTRESAYVERERGILEQAHAAADRHGVPVTSLVRIGHDVSRAILETAREHECNLILLGWRGYTTTAQRILGEVADAVVTHARSDIMLIKLVDGAPLNRILLPSAGGEHARLAEAYAAAILRERGGSLTVCGVAPPDAAEDRVVQVTARLAESVERIRQRNGFDVDMKVIRHRSVPAGVIEESDNYDAVMVGAAGGSMYQNILFGTIPEVIAKRSARPVIMVKHYHPVKHLLGRVMGE